MTASTFDPSRVADPLFVQQGRMPAHSDHRWFADEAEASSGDSSFEASLDGVWKFRYSRNPAEAPADFWAPGYDHATWDDIPVPGHIQLHGYDRPQYVNTQYPWDGHEEIDPGQIPRLFNPVADYVRTFTLDTMPAPGERLTLTFNGAESAMALWVNGSYIGYATDSFTPSEFDVTGAVVSGTNTVAVRVMKWSAGSWIEDQDFYRFSGLFRSVVLRRLPVRHVRDVRTRVEVADDLASALVRVDLAIDEGGPTPVVGDDRGGATLTLEGVGELTPDGAGAWSIEVADPHLWSDEDPHLYDLVIEVRDSSGTPLEYIPLRVGLRRFGIEDGVLRINGSRVVFRGVNRHEFGLQGRVMTPERTWDDLVFMKAHNINAVRTSHYPNNSFLYAMCDELGLYVIDEMNLESHGMWDRIEYAGMPVEEALPGDRPEWLPMLLDRAASMTERDKNHACVVMWSCGNESFGGRDIFEVSEWFRAHDTRPVHYEGVHWDPRYPATTDVVSQMYTPADEVERFLVGHRDKPFILCEFAHAMGNSFGAVRDYVDLTEREPLFQGGFIWDFADQAILLRDRHGRDYFGYGGDCGEAPHDGDFSGNGILFADHTPKPLAREVKAVYQPLRIAVDAVGGTVEILNKLLFTPSDAYEARVLVEREGHPVGRAVLPTEVPPGESATYPLTVPVPTVPGEYAVTVSFHLRRPTPWAPAGHEVAFGQGTLVRPAGSGIAPALVGADSVGTDLALTVGTHNVGVRGEHFEVLFSRRVGAPVSYRFGSTRDGGRELLRGTPRPSFWHAPTSNERGWGSPVQDGPWLLASRYSTFAPGANNPSVSRVGEAVEVRSELELAGGCGHVRTTYQVHPDGRVSVGLHLEGTPSLPPPPEFGMLIPLDADLDRLRWYGDGPEESAVDRRAGARLGVWSARVEDQLTPYLRPQESGSHTGVRWAEVRDAHGWGLRVGAVGGPDIWGTRGMELSALPWTPFEVENALHPQELPAPVRTILRPALMRRGVGGDNSWGARTHPEFELPTGGVDFRYEFRGVM